MGGQLDKHLLFWQPTISIIFYMLLHCTCCFRIEMEIKYDDDDDHTKMQGEIHAICGCV